MNPEFRPLKIIENNFTQLPKMKRHLLLVIGILWTLFVSAQTNGDWTELGPKDFPPHLNWQLSGVARISQMKFHPSDPNTLYAVNAMGGLFISKDKGEHWVKTGADNLPPSRCASVCIDYTNDQILYFGTGDPSYYQRAYGIWKSTDGGFNWNSVTNGIGNRMAVEILMSPLDHNVLIAATDDGIWKTTDGGANWSVKKSGGQFTEMVFRPGINQSTIYAANHSEFWKSTDMGETWTRISLPGNGIQNGGRIAVTKADPNVVYVSFVGDHGSGNDTPVLKSTDSGNSFFTMKGPGYPNLNGYDAGSGGQGNYDYAISADPNDANHLMACAHIIWTSYDGGANWTQISLDWAHQVHADQRQIPFSPYTANEVYNVNDGGIWRSWDNGKSWLPICNGLVGTESYIGTQSPVKKDAVSIGAQDNGELVYWNGIWYNNGAGDYHSNIISDNVSGNYYYDLSGTGRRRWLPEGGSDALNLPFNAGNGQSVYSDFPLTSTSTAYLGYQNVYRSMDMNNSNPTWTQISFFNRQVKAIASSPTDANVLYVVTDDGLIRRSDNALSGSPTWNTYNTPSATNVTASLVVLKSNTNVVYMVCNNKVYRSGNKGVNWSDVTGNLPNVNYHKIVQDVYSTTEAVYLAGYNSVFYKDNTLGNWVNFSKGLPSVVNFYRFYIYNDGTDNSELTFISAGRGVWHTGLYGRHPVLRTPENPQNAISGIVYNDYEGTWNHLPNFNSLTPVKTGATDVPSINVRSREDNIGITFDGYIDVPVDGKYNFYTSSDDGSMFYIGNEVVVDNDGLHGDQEATGYMWLKAGKHKFTLTFFNGTGGKSLTFSWDGPGFGKQLVPASRLYRLSPMSTCPENGSISVEKWTNIGGTSVTNIPTGTAANLTFTNPNFESKTDDGDNYGVRYRGYICPPYTGTYTFYIASDDNSEFWLSTTGDPANKVKICYQNGAVDQRNWYGNASQKSSPISLKAGQKYYVEALHKEGGGGDHFAAAWVLPSGEFEAPIPGAHLSPYKNNTFPTVSITAPINNYAVISGSNISVTANATDADGTISKVEFFLDDIKVGETTTTPYNYAWNSVSAGTYKLSARATDNQGAVSVSNVVAVTVVNLRDPENPALTKPAMDYKYYEYTGDWSVLPDYSTLTPVKTGTNAQFDINIRNRDNNYGIAYRGFIDIPTDGIYTFYVSSDDGAKLYFGTQLLIDNDGLHGMGDVSQVIGLKKGKHAINLDFFQNTGGQGLQLSYSGPGITKQVIPASVLYRQIFSNNPPAITLTSDKASGIAPASFTLTANATDSDGTIAKVEFYNGTTLLTTDNAAPHTYNWTNVAVGTYTVTAKAYDDNNAVTTSSAITITVVANQAPTVSITAPANNTTYLAPASFTISATSSDADGSIAKVEFYNGGTLLGTSTTSPYNYSWTNVAVGTYTITAKAYDNLGLATTSSAITVKVNANQAPTVSITAPATNSVYVAQANITITATAADADGSVAKVEFYNGTNLLGQSTSSPYTYSWTNVGAGTYTITAKAYDNLGLATTSSAITVQVNGNQNPTVSITSPANNASFISPATIAINATASDVDGTVTKVDFYNGGTLLGTDNSSPYSYTWSGVAAGTYTLTAKATDDKNGTTTSTSVKLIVNNPNVAPTVNITSPVNNATFVAPSDISITANASDADGSISKVEFYNGASLIGTAYTSPYSYTWTGVTAGTYTITAKAYDNVNATTTSSAITVKVNVNQDPTISVTASSNGPNSVSISVNASDPDGSITKVEYYDGTTKIGESTSSPYTFTWSNAPAGSHAITAVAIDDKGGKTTSNPITITVANPNQLPAVSITSPVTNSGYTEPATITIQATASDPDGTIQKVEFYNGTIKLGESTFSPYSYTWSNVIAGTYTITAKAYDDQNGITTSAPVTVIVNANQAPTVSITSPADQDKFNENATITITAAANDPDGSIQKVEFYYGATYLGNATTEPYTIVWQNVPAGTYTITAKAYDNLNKVTSSSGITIYVQTVSGIDDSILVKNNIRVYPNPVYTDINIEFSVINHGSVSMKLYDVKGNVVKVIKEENFDQGHFTLHDDLSALPDGVYLLRTIIGNQVFTTQIFKGSKPKNAGKFQSKK